MTTQKNIHDNEPKGDHDLVKHGSNDPRGKGAAAPPAPGQQQGQTGQMQRQPPSAEDQQMLQKRQQEAWDAAAEREKSNNPATRPGRQYDKNAPGMHPANQPTENTRINKGTRVDLEDLTGNPGHRGVNPDAPANSINGPPADRTGRVESINEPSHVDQNYREGTNLPQQQMQGSQPRRPGDRTQTGAYPEQQNPVGAGVEGSINEPPGSQVIPPGAGAGSGTGGEGGNQPQPGPGEGGPTITSLDPDSVAIGGGNATFGLTVTGSGFDSTCKIVFDDEEQDTDFVSETELRAIVPMQDEPGEVDVEVEKGEEASEVLTFEFTEAASRAKREATRKPKKPTRAAKRDTSGKKKGKR